MTRERITAGKRRQIVLADIATAHGELSEVLYRLAQGGDTDYDWVTSAIDAVRQTLDATRYRTYDLAVRAGKQNGNKPVKEIE